MTGFIPAPIIGVIALSLYTLSIFLWTSVLLLTGILKFLIPISPIRKKLSHLMHILPLGWTATNARILRYVNCTELDICGLEKLSRKEWYLIISNHQNWSDILLLQIIFNLKTPILKFFLKKELIWVPILGLACWLLDFPFIYRYSKEKLKKHPELKGKDIEATLKACEKFKKQPVAIVNFPEGTRFTEEKQYKRGSPYKNLLPPKSGGTAMTLGIIGDTFKHLLNVTIIYPHENKNAWDFFSGKMKKVIIHIQTIPIDENIIGDYIKDKAYRSRFQKWLNQVWKEKDDLISSEIKKMKKDDPQSVKQNEAEEA